MGNNRILIDQLSSIRRANNMSQKELSKKTGISVKHICEMETHKTNPTIETLAKYAKGLEKKIIVKISNGST